MGRYPRSSGTARETRVCGVPECATVLSRYNDGEQCSVHDPAGVRAALEDGFAEHKRTITHQASKP